MSNKLLAVTLLILLAVVAAVLYTKSKEEVVKVVDISVSFICENEQHFTADFDINFETLRVMENGELTRELSKGDEKGMHFSNNDFEYTFAGEEVEVLHKSTNEQFRCHQPFDPNNAPYNFGDRAEGAGEEQDVIAAVKENILGSWVSVDDEKFKREFKSDGTVIDSYDGEEATSSPWMVFTSLSGLDTEFPQSPDIIYLQIITGTLPEDTLYFSLSKLTGDELELIYMNRGGVLRFIRAE